MRAWPPRIVVATRNPGKLHEIREILADENIEWKSLSDYPDSPEATEAAADYLSNAREKAALAAAHCGEWALADDSGLEVEALNGQPGHRSARYAGATASDADNVEKLLRALEGISSGNRRAVFRAVMVLRHPDGREYVGSGELRGRIAEAPRGTGGFGYDPIFLPETLESSLAELSSAEKNRLSHRRRALARLNEILNNLK